MVQGWLCSQLGTTLTSITPEAEDLSLFLLDGCKSQGSVENVVVFLHQCCTSFPCFCKRWSVVKDGRKTIFMQFRFRF